MNLRRTIAWIAVAALVAGCGSDTASENLDTPRIVVTTSVLGDVVRQIVGEDAEVEVLMGPGADPHDFAASAQQVARLMDADLVVANGLGLEESLLDILESAEEAGVPVLHLADDLDPIEFDAAHGTHEDEEHEDEEHEDEEQKDDHGHGDLDPHFWQDPLRMADATTLIADALTAMEPEVDWMDRASRVADDLTTLHDEVSAILEPIPMDRRILVTNHEAFGYFAERYGFEVIGTVIPGGGTLAEPSPGDLADLVAEIEEEQVRAIFAENTNPSALADAVAAEVGAQVVVRELVSDSLTDQGGAAPTYREMILFNARTIAEALGG